MRHVKRPKHGGANESIRAGIVIAFAAALLLPATASALDPPEPQSVLFVANGYYQQETIIRNHLLSSGAYTVAVKKDYQIKGTTSLAPYDLIVLTEFAPYVSTAGINNIKSSGKPVLVVEYWDFNYSKKLGLTTSASCGYVGTDTIEAVREGYDAFTSRVGVEALVYQPSYTVYGIDASKLTAGVTPLYWSSASFGEVAMLVHRAKKVAVTGVYDTRKYTVDAWKMFDLLVEQVVPPRPRWQSMQDVAQAYVDSGLYSFLAQVESDLARDPGSWTFDEVEREAWLLTTAWNLRELWGHTYETVCELLEIEPDLPQFQFTYDHPERPHGTNPGFLDPQYPDEHEHWFLGQHWDAANQVAPPPHWGEYHAGTDLGLGVSVRLFGKNVFYMGDTWDLDYPANTMHMWSFNECEVENGVRCDDMIVVSTDQSPENGVDVSPELEWDTDNEEERWTPLVIPGVHKKLAPELTSGYWSDLSNEPHFTAPTGAVITSYLIPITLNGQPGFLILPQVVLWYATGMRPDVLDAGDPAASPRSWVGCSFDGIVFRACYTDGGGNAVPFSEYAPQASPPGPARFINVAAVDLTHLDLDRICQGSSPSDMCQLDDPLLPANQRGGLLLYGAGRPYRLSGLYLGFIKRMDIGRLDDPPPVGTGKPLVHYWTGSDWSTDEQAA
ncbi:MAG TPA: hypothetical protein VM285_12625, partial [Polyangia bacterium]|nr:hypothetical protein [Polyangia bacterium]